MSSLELFFTDSDSEELYQEHSNEDPVNLRKERRRIRDKINPLDMDEKMFLKTFGLSKEAFMFVVKRIDDKLVRGIYNTKIPTILKLAITLKFCSQASYQRGMGDENTFGVAQPTVSVVMTEMLEVMEYSLCPEFIDFTSTETHEAKLFFYKKSGIPGVIGIIDGTHIKLMAPRKDLQHLYRNGRGFFAINTMIVCDHQMKIRYINAKTPGSFSKSDVFEKSKLKTYLETKYQNSKENAWLLGNSSYELEPYLLTPYKDAKVGTIESRYNIKHEKCRHIMDDVINILRNRWRCLLGTQPLHYTPSKATKIINVCAALHNICITYNVPFDEELIEIPDSVPEVIEIEEGISYNKKAVAKRNEVARAILVNF